MSNLVAKKKISEEKDRRATAQTIASYDKAVQNLVEATQRRIKITEKADRIVTARDLIDQHYARATIFAKSTARVERTALLRAFLLGVHGVDDGNPNHAAWTEIGETPIDATIANGEQLLRDWLSKTDEDAHKKNNAATDRIRKNAEDAEKLLAKHALGERVKTSERIKAMNAIIEWENMRQQTKIFGEVEMLALLAGFEPERLGHKGVRREYGKVPLDKWIETGKLINPELEHPGAIYRQETLTKPITTTARVFFEATLATGLRPVEWLNTEFIVDDPLGNPMPAIDAPDPDAAAVDPKRNPRIVVENAKTTLSPTKRNFRTLRLGELPRETIRAILWASALRHAEINAEKWSVILVRINKAIDKAARENGFSDGMSLYDLRHFFASRAKRILPREEVAALMGHGAIYSARAYGRRTRRGSGSASGGSSVRPHLPIADQNDVAAVEAVLTRKQEAKQRLEKTIR